jgi:hypothetical protein
MIRLTTDEKLRAALIQKGFEQAAKFSWKAMAEHVQHIYSELGATSTC